jgi:hypothetical protein
MTSWCNCIGDVRLFGCNNTSGTQHRGHYHFHCQVVTHHLPDTRKHCHCFHLCLTIFLNFLTCLKYHWASDRLAAWCLTCILLSDSYADSLFLKEEELYQRILGLRGLIFLLVYYLLQLLTVLCFIILDVWLSHPSHHFIELSTPLLKETKNGADLHTEISICLHSGILWIFTENNEHAMAYSHSIRDSKQCQTPMKMKHKSHIVLWFMAELLKSKTTREIEWSHVSIDCDWDVMLCIEGCQCFGECTASIFKVEK